MRSAIAFFPLLLLLLIGTAAALVYFIIYKRKINRIVMSQNASDDPDAFTARDAAGPEPSSVADKLFKAGALIIIVVLLIKLSNANNSLSALESSVNTLSRDVQTLRNTVYSLSSDTASAESILSDFDFSIGDFSPSDNTVELKIFATPKNLTEGTKVGVRLGDRYAELTRGAGSTYTGTMKVGIFEQLYDSFTVDITNDGVTASEVCDMSLGVIWPKIIPTVHVASNGTYSSGSKLKLDMQIDLSIEKTEFASYNKTGIRLIETLGNEVLSDTDISSDITWTGDEGHYHISLDKKLSDADGKEYVMKLYAEDSFGYRHEITVVSTGETADSASSFLNEKIFGADGKLLNEGAYSFY